MQYLSGRKVAHKINVECELCDMHQGDKVESSASGELTRSKDNVIVSAFPQGSEIMAKLRNVVKHFESNPTNRRNYDLVLKCHRCILTNAFKRYSNDTNQC